ncbi:hypothetical protein ACKWRH_36205 [Bradyrhizobium sp. Pa8]|uniref:hypothetical protein n=1 Tax=Bradyrhizobium sp. Pa8 TaxID=3386552 RepID=UPI00403F5C44
MRHPDRRGKGVPQPRFLDLLAEAFQRRFHTLALPADGRTELRAGPPKEVEGVLGAAAEMIELRCERGDIKPVGLIERHRKSQQRELPGTEQPVRAFD